MNTLFNFFNFNLFSLIIVAQLAYMCGTLEASRAMLNATIKNTLTSPEEEKVTESTTSPLTGTTTETEQVSPLTKPELVNVTRTSDKKQGGK